MLALLVLVRHRALVRRLVTVHHPAFPTDPAESADTLSTMLLLTNPLSTVSAGLTRPSPLTGSILA